MAKIIEMQRIEPYFICNYCREEMGNKPLKNMKDCDGTPYKACPYCEEVIENA